MNLHEEIYEMVTCNASIAAIIAKVQAKTIDQCLAAVDSCFVKIVSQGYCDEGTAYLEREEVRNRIKGVGDES